jgi:taurine dioxygenase
MHTARLLGLPWEDSRALLHAVYDHLYAPQNETEHRWRKGDIVLWDNLTYQHARGSLTGAGRRVLQRVVAGA